jgi:hypothetical protein
MIRRRYIILMNGAIDRSSLALGNLLATQLGFIVFFNPASGSTVERPARAGTVDAAASTQ